MANGKNAPKSRPSAQKKGSAKKATKGGNSRARPAGREAAKSDDGGLLGIALIAIGVLLILGVWFSLAGPAGDGAGTFLGWFLGIGRHVLPIVLIGSGVAVLRDHEPQEPIRLGVGWVLAVLSSLGFIHVIRTPTSLTDLDALGQGQDRVGRCVVRVQGLRLSGASAAGQRPSQGDGPRQDQQRLPGHVTREASARGV